MKRLAIGALATLLLVSCSSSSTAAPQPNDEFLDKAETACRDATASIRKIDKTDSSATSDLSSAISDMSDTLDDLRAPDELKDDFDKYTSNIDEQVVELKKVATTRAANDTSAMSDAVTKLNTLRSSSDSLVNTLEIFSCLGVVPVDGFTSSGSTDTTTPDTSPPDTSTPDTTPETTPSTDAPPPPTTQEPPTEATTPETNASPTTNGPDTNTGDTLLPGDLSSDAKAPDGYTWVSYTPPDVKGLYDNPTIGKLVTYYSGAELQSSTDGSTATVYIVRLSEDFNPADTKAYQFWEAVDKGKDVATPGGLTVHQQLEAFKDTDCAVYVSGDRGVTICTYTGYDGLTLMDQFIAANPK